MKPEELRIGNYIKPSSYDNIYYVKAINRHDLVIGDIKLDEGTQMPHYYSYDNIEGIPLTEEWLKKFGFEDIAANYCRQGILKIEKWANGYCYSALIGIEYETKDFDINYVHQLQNLYYALTGEELRIKE